jgi:hypothetical protein
MGDVSFDYRLIIGRLSGEFSWELGSLGKTEFSGLTHHAGQRLPAGTG